MAYGHERSLKETSGDRLNGVSILLFDLGGVLVQWEGSDGLLELTEGRLSREDARKFWLHSPWVRRFEAGRCSGMDFASGAVEELGLAVSAEEFLARFTGWDRGPLPGAHSLLEELRPRFVLACLSNNNEIHWPRIRDEFGFGRLFDKRYLSHEIGLIKPEREIFDYVLRDLSRPAESILFLDDNPECVEAARAVGMRAELARGVEAVRGHLRI